VILAHTGGGPVDRAHTVHSRAGESIDDRRTLLGLVTAAVWLVGLAVGGFALVAGHPVVAAVSVVLALVSPWFGLAWNLHARLRADDGKLPFTGNEYRLPLTAR
jgi:Flp pilus assembly protein TadB